MADSLPPDPREPGPPAFGAADAMQILRENFLLLVLGLALGIGCGLLAQRLIPRAYESRAKFMVNDLPYFGDQTHGGLGADAEQQLVQTLILGIPSRDMHDEVARQLRISPKQIAFTALDLPLSLTGPQLRANVRVSSTDKSRLGEITVVSQSPEFAAQVANAILDELQLFNLVGGRLKTLRLSMDLAKSKVDSTVTQLVDATSQRIKLAQENAELDAHIRDGRPLTDFPAFAQDGTLNNLKTQLILVSSEYDSIAATATRGPRLAGKRAELAGLRAQLQAHVEALAGSLRSAYEIAKTQERNLESDVKTSKEKIDAMAEEAARDAQSLSNPAAMRAIAAAPAAPAAGPANVIVTIDRAAPIRKPARPKLWLNLLLGVVFGGALGGGGVALRLLLDQRLKTARHVEQRTVLPCLAMLPPLDLIERRNSRPFRRPRTPIGLGYLRSYFLRTSLDRHTRQIVGFTPCRQKEDCSRLVAALGVLLALSDRRTLVIDLSHGRPQIAPLLGVSESGGLSRWLASGQSLPELVAPTIIRELGVLDFAPGKASGIDNLLGRQPLSAEIPRLLEHWDFILIASPAIRFDWTLMLALPAGSPLVLCADYRRATTDDVTATRLRARSGGWTVEGAVLQCCPPSVAGAKSL